MYVRPQYPNRTEKIFIDTLKLYASHSLLHIFIMLYCCIYLLHYWDKQKVIKHSYSNINICNVMYNII